MQNCSYGSDIFTIWMAFFQIPRSFLSKTQNHNIHQLKTTKRALVTSNAIHLTGSRILHYIRFTYPIWDTPILDPDLGPRFGTPIWTPIWDPDLGPRFGTPIWDPNLKPRFGTLSWDLDLGHPHLGPLFWTLIWDPDLGPRFGTPI
jgi:hypothetical protein